MHNEPDQRAGEKFFFFKWASATIVRIETQHKGNGNPRPYEGTPRIASMRKATTPRLQKKKKAVMPR